MVMMPVLHWEMHDSREPDQIRCHEAPDKLGSRGWGVSVLMPEQGVGLDSRELPDESASAQEYEKRKGKRRRVNG